MDFVLFDNNVKYVLAEPIPDKENDAIAYKKFLDDDFRARHIILGCVHDDIHLAFHHHQSAKSLLDALTSFFATPSHSKSRHLYRSFRNYKMSEGTNVDEHLLKMRVMFQECELQGRELSKYEKAKFLVNSLPETGTWRDLILQLSIQLGGEKGLSVEDVEQRARDWQEYLKDCGEEEEGSISGSSGSSTRRLNFNGNCYDCGEFGHRQADCPYEVRVFLFLLSLLLYVCGYE